MESLFGRRREGGAKPKPFEQVFVVMRHSERLDFTDMAKWLEDPASELFPNDCPITEYGEQLAVEEALAISRLVTERGTHIDIIVTSPFHRCVATAVACRSVLPLKPDEKKPPLVLDVELGEVNAYFPPDDPSFTPEMLEQHEELCQRRRTSWEVSALAVMADVETLNGGDFVGQPPAWCEARRYAHVRALDRFAEWIERGRQLRLNILVVTHQDLVHVFCAMSNPKLDIGEINYCGWGAALIPRAQQLVGGSCWPWQAQKGLDSDAIPRPLHKLRFETRIGAHVRWSAARLNQDLERVRPNGSSVAAAAVSVIRRTGSAVDLMEQYSRRGTGARRGSRTRLHSMLILKPILSQQDSSGLVQANVSDEVAEAIHEENEEAYKELHMDGANPELGMVAKAEWASDRGARMSSSLMMRSVSKMALGVEVEVSGEEPPSQLKVVKYPSCPRPPGQRFFDMPVESLVKACIVVTMVLAADTSPSPCTAGLTPEVGWAASPSPRFGPGM